MSAAELRFASYPWRDTPQPLLTCGPNTGPQILVLQPLFGEMNRMRRLLGAIIGLLGGEGLGCWMPDLPGLGESMTALSTADFAGWREAAASAAAFVAAESGRPPLSAAFRAGCLLDDSGTAAQWRLSPLSGRRALRGLIRTRIASDKEEGHISTSADIDTYAAQDGIELAGYRLSAGLYRGLAGAVPANGADRTVRLEGDAEKADAHLPGSPLWRRAEPGHSPELAAAIAADIASWARRCAG